MTKFVNMIKFHSDLILVFILGFILRIKDFLRDDFWYDEAFTGLLIKAPPQEFQQILIGDVHPPFYMYVAKAWSSLFGVTDFSLRFLSLIFGMVTIYVVYKLVLVLFSKKEIALIAAFLTSINPFNVGYSYEGRSYTLYGLIALLTFYALYTKKYNFFIFGLCVMIYTHYMSLVFILLYVIYYLKETGLDAFHNKTFEVKIIGKNIIRLIPFIVFYIYIYNNGILTSIRNQNIEWADISAFYNIPDTFTSYSYGVKVKQPGKSQANHIDFILDENKLGRIILVLYFSTTTLILFLNIRNKKRIEPFLASSLLFLLPQLILIIYGMHTNKNVYVERYIFPSSLFFIISVSYIVTYRIKFEITALILLFYLFTVSKIQPVNTYYKGMKSLYANFRDYNGELIFTSPADYTIARYYFNDYEKVKLSDPKNPNERYLWWWFVYESSAPKEIPNALFITPDESRMTEEYIKVDTGKETGTYKIYRKN
ncbi:hypothetical protein A3F07_01395 [candidate division WWE3 bacterium RIFCSPHIGHO2_12_FULL_38_15]|uniref:Glycosyltransferase RgtA/B/C/D-like domain-containing protein n=1 Tax=candidate division WWE3 bacterium RIFCSPHIGHO2_02_FULL_38_14 TaxID=1802620 RepID=A0A1F4V8T2_UNCKA|nr:MAG: hypothetical protein A2793_01900 [candidate division WWE3 bacterium RIFCSPHIGHO2_01_FULL_38_45]OGC48361.1 MAG: hypothetical protein A3F07_01395 [candidate division WWE3 bacterium RIFCSPHIGHO2_12_FULL_38_15]OGC53661.1 MAG: hypothetical protein A3D91_04455 [candidate division WWE3 bacterium RIFCSPHIGHO2_02_FULL_38_14]OGC54296.1 MAG: hypothetical protein A3B64_02195 [candidate division WWE3 bacterium RIFCSPLOWO2_01_FULL_37_24]HLB51540.1 glycosyltransferase family 39 protein [Patescibacteri